MCLIPASYRLRFRTRTSFKITTFKHDMCYVESMHCKDVSVRDVDFPLTRENIVNHMDGWQTYVRTEFLIFRNGNDLAVVELKKSPGTELFRSLESYNIVSLPDEIVFHNDPNLDVLNTPALAKVQALYPGKTVVVRGMFSHINFIKDLNPIKLRLIDNVPPTPSKLSVLTEIALASGFIDYPIITESIEIDMAEKIPEVETEAIVFPCKISGLHSDKPYYFLDEAPVIDKEVTLIGCNLSQRIFKSLYDYEAPILNVCPSDNIIEDGVKTLVKCCKIKTGHKIEGNVASVPWGATVPEIVGAINALFSEDSE